MKKTIIVIVFFVAVIIIVLVVKNKKDKQDIANQKNADQKFFSNHTVAGVYQ